MNARSALFVAILFGAALCARGQTRSPQQWINVIDRQANEFQLPPDFRWQAVRRVCGWTLPDQGGKRWMKHEVAEDYPVFAGFMDTEGYDILNRILQHEPLTAAEEPYRLLMLALYLRAAQDYSGRRPVPTDRGFLLDMTRVHGSQDDCRACYDRVVEEGRKAIRKGILEQRLSTEDVQAIRLYRIASGTRGVGECFLPSHFGLHPYMSGDESFRTRGHGDPAVKEANFGKPYHDFRLARFESVLRRSSYTDVVDYSYHWTYPLRPEGVLEFLRPLTCCRPSGDGLDNVRVEWSPECLNLPPGETPVDYVRLRDLIGKPILLYVNDPVDAPVQEMFERFEVLYQAYRDRMHIFFVAVNIHDWFYSGMREFFTGPGPSQHPVGHAWCEEERARKLKNRYLECPHATFPALIDNDAQTIKNLYGAGGGANHFVIIDRRGRIAEFVTNQHGGLNEVEDAIRRTLENDGLMAPHARIEEDHERTQVPELEPLRHRVRLLPGRVAQVHLAEEALTVHVKIGDRQHEYRVDLKPASRLTSGGRQICLSEVQPGSGVRVECYLDEMVHGAVPRPDYQKLQPQAFTCGGRRLTLEPLGGYGRLRRTWYLMADSQPQPLTARSIQVLPAAAPAASRWDDPVTIWACGRVSETNPADRTLTVERLSPPSDDYKGLRFWRQAQDRGRPLFPNETVTRRLAVVEQWAGGASEKMTVRIDNAVDLLLDGRFGAAWDDIRIGDFVAVQFEAVQYDQPVILPHTVRISR